MAELHCSVVPGPDRIKIDRLNGWWCVAVQIWWRDWFG